MYGLFGSINYLFLYQDIHDVEWLFERYKVYKLWISIEEILTNHNYYQITMHLTSRVTKNLKKIYKGDLGSRATAARNRYSRCRENNYVSKN